MYRKHWGLTPGFLSPHHPRNPIFPSEAREEALARIQYLIDEGHRLGLLAAESGLGKTSLFEQLARERSIQGFPVALVNPLGMDEQELLLKLCTALGNPSDPPASIAQLWQSFSELLWANQQMGWTTLLLVDDAHEADSDVLTALTRIVQSEPSVTARVTTILSVVPDRVALLGRRLRELADLQIELTRWDPGETAAYLRWATQQSGVAEPIFQADAVDEIHRIADGVPRQICTLAELALVAGAGNAQQQVDRLTIAAIEGEARWSDAPSLIRA